MAKRAERAYRRELGISDSSFVQFGAWDSLHKGLLAGEKLSLDLRRLEKAYLEGNRRTYEITKYVSLVLHDPLALIALKETGSCDLILPETLFDVDYPGHYARYIKSIGLTIPCVIGPYTNINCTLSLLNSKIRVDPNPGTKYRENLEGPEPDNRFDHRFGSIQQIATSRAQNDTGMFELNFRDERLLPFEGAGAISTWRIELPEKNNAFDFDTISDVVLTLNYAAREGGEVLRIAAQEALAAMREAGDLNPPLNRFFSARHEFTNEWHGFLNPKEGAKPKLEITFGQERFPFLFRGANITLKEATVFLVPKDDLVSFDGVNLELAAGTEKATIELSTWKPDLTSVVFGAPKKPEEPSEPIELPELGATWVLQGPENLNLSHIADVWILLTYTVKP
jgi:hypothetical protein